MIIQEVTITMETILTGVGSFFTQAVTWMGDIVDFIVEHPLTLLMVVAMPVAGWAIGGLRRLIRL